MTEPAAPTGGSAQPRTRAEIETELAQTALHRGEALLAAGDPAGARPWLERAARIARDDDTVALPLALALVSLGDPDAGAALAALATRHDVRELWLALARLRLRQGDAAGAAGALAASLAGHRLADVEAMAKLGGAIVARSGAAGWCGLTADGHIVARCSGDGRPAIAVDGRLSRGTRAPPAAAQIAVTLCGRHLLGSPLRADRMQRVEGFVGVRDGGLQGWAWYPGDAGRDPVLTILSATGARRRIVATDTAMAAPRPLSQPRRFVIPAAALLGSAGLAGIAGPVSVIGSDGRDLTGSPLDPGLELRAAAAAARAVARALPALGRARGKVPWLPTPAGLVGPPAAALRRPRRRLAVVVPVYRGLAMTLACLDAVFATVPRATTVIVVDDATPEPALAAALGRLAAAGRIVLVRHARNRGFPEAANAGLRAAAALASGPDAVLLNSDTVPAPDWLATLRAAVHASADIGTAAPLSNDAAILSYPDPNDPAKPPDAAGLAAHAALAGRVHGAASVPIPTSVGFCMYVRRECLVEVGLLRPDVFGQGYGEENDFCIRAGHLGWRHVAVPGAFVAHLGGQSFGDARAHLLARNLDVLDRLHPGYRTAIMAWLAADPLAPARRALDMARWAARPSLQQPASGGAVIVVTHDSGGGVERAVRARCAALRAAGLRPILLRPVVDRAPDPAAPPHRYVPGLCTVGDGTEGGYPNLQFRLPESFDALAALLRAERPALLEVHHLLGHDHAVVGLAAALGIPYEFRVHDYAAICPRINLVAADGRYCGEPDVAVCANCVADGGSHLEEAIAPAALRQRSAADFAGARAVVAPSADTAARLRRHFPAIVGAVQPHEPDAALPPLRPLAAGPRVVGVIGAIGTAKGYDVLLACARDSAARDLQLSFKVIGHSEDDARLLATGRVFVTGPYRDSDAVALIGRENVDLAWLPSIWPETWCYALGQALLAGLPVAAFDIGAQAARIRATGRGWLLPLGLPAATINNALLALHTIAGDECAPSGHPAAGLQPKPVLTSKHSQRAITARS